MNLVPSILAAQRAGIELWFGELGPGPGGRKRLNNEGAIGHGTQHRAASKPREPRGGVETQRWLDILGDGAFVEFRVLERWQRHRGGAGAGRRCRSVRRLRGSGPRSTCSWQRGGGSIGECRAEAEGPGAARAGESLGRPDQVPEVAKGVYVGTEHGLQEMGKAGRIRRRLWLHQ